MKIKNKKITIKQFLCLVLYYCIAKNLPSSTSFLGKLSKSFRYILVKTIFKKCGKNVNVEKGAIFGSGLDVIIGDNSGIGVNCKVPSNIIIGNNVMMGPNCYFLDRNHAFNDTSRPMNTQGYSEKKQTIIGNDVWIGRNVIATPGRIIADGSIIAAGCVLCKNFPEYSIVGGNPSKLIRSRK